MSLPIPRLWVPLTLVGTETVKVQLDGDTGTTYTATTIAGVFYDPEEFLATMRDKINDATGGNSVVVTLDVETGKVTISVDAGTIKLTNGSLNEQLGFLAAGTAGFAASQTAPYQIQNLWNPGEAVRFDEFDRPKVEEALSIALSGAHQGVTHGSRTVREIGFDYLPIAKVIQSQEGTALNESFDRVWPAMKTRFRYWPDRADLATYGDYFLESPRDTPKAKRMRPRPAIYSLDLKFGAYVE